mgnify:CR=1 FL=1
MSLAELRARGVLELLDLELARTLCRIAKTDDEETALAIALTSRSVRQGHSCFPMRLDDDQICRGEASLLEALPERSSWIGILAASPLCDGGPLVHDVDGRLFLRRFWQLARTASSASSIRRSNRSCIAFSFSRRSRLRHKMYVSLPPSGEGQIFTSRPSRIVRQSSANSSRSNFLSVPFDAPMI